MGVVALLILSPNIHLFYQGKPSMKGATMFHPHFWHLFFNTHDCLTDAMALAAAFKVEMDAQRSWEEQRERERRIDCDRVPEHKSERQVREY